MKPIFVLCFYSILIAAPHTLFGEEKKDEMRIETITKKNIELTTQVPKECTSGNNLNVRLSIQNQSNSEIQYYETSPYVDFQIFVSKDNKDIPQTLFGKKVIGDASDRFKRILRNLPSKNQTFVELNLAQLFDLSSPGDYSFTFTREVLLENKEVLEKKERIVLELAVKIILSKNEANSGVSPIVVSDKKDP